MSRTILIVRQGPNKEASRKVSLNGGRGSDSGRFGTTRSYPLR